MEFSVIQRADDDHEGTIEHVFHGEDKYKIEDNGTLSVRQHDAEGLVTTRRWSAVGWLRVEERPKQPGSGKMVAFS